VQGEIWHVGPPVTTDREGRFEIRAGPSFPVICFAFNTDKSLARAILWEPGQTELTIALLPVVTVTGMMRMRMERRSRMPG